MAAQDSVRDTFGISSNVQPAPGTFIAGVELEIEDTLGIAGGLPGGWHSEDDGSLRNYGMEFISPPLAADSLIAHFQHIHARLNTKTGKKEHFSDRTSIHVHVNCLDLTQEQVKSVLLWYALFEPVFFAMVAPTRSNNIHCVALDQTSLSEHYRRTLPLYVQKWSKYTALNLLPLSSQGTIEFRHMEGHNNTERFKDWMLTLKNLWTFGQETQMTKKAIDSQEKILTAFDCIFKDSAIKSIRASVPALVADNLIDIKLALA